MPFIRLVAAALLSVIAINAAPPPAPLLEESFRYADGPLHQVSAGAWRAQRGPSAIVVQSGRALVPAVASAEAAVSRAFAPPGAGARVELSFTLRVDTVSSTATGDSIPLQFASDDGRKRRARLAVRVLPDGSCRVGVASKFSEGIVWAEAELSRFEEHAVRIVYDSASGRASLWVDAGPDEAPAAESTDTDVIEPARVMLTQPNRPGAHEVRIGALAVRVLAAGERGGAQASLTPRAATLAETPAVEPPPSGFRVFLLIGQSNMAGRGVVEEVDRRTDARILVWRPDGSWGLAQEPLHRDKPAVAGVGPGYAFARELLRSLPAGESVGLIPAAFGGSRISWWQKGYEGSQRWPDGRAYFQHAVDAARAAPPGSLAGVLWIQGESDLGAARADGGSGYRKQLHALVRDLRAELGRPDLPFVAATLKPWNAAEAVAVNEVYLALPGEVARTAVVNTISPELMPRLKNKSDDLPHYDSASARLLGEHFARAMLPLLAPAPVMMARAGARGE